MWIINCYKIILNETDMMKKKLCVRVIANFFYQNNTKLI